MHPHVQVRMALSHTNRVLARCPFTASFQHRKLGAVLRGVAAEARRGARALAELQEELEEDAAGTAAACLSFY
jgi:hypothetical protein